MGRLEKQIIAAAIGLVGILLIAVLFADGLVLTPEVEQAPTQFADPVSLIEASPSLQIQSLPTTEALVIDLFAAPEPRPSAEAVAAQDASISNAAMDEVARPQPADLPATVSYKVQPGDVFSRIVSKQLGSIKRAPEVLALNPGLEPDVLMPGDEILIPNPVLPAVLKVEAPEVESALGGSFGGAKTHKVLSGDSLWKLARKYLGDGNPSSIQRFVDVNPSLGDVDAVLQIGHVLVVPE